MSRELDARVAEALGLDVVGEARCWFVEGEWAIRGGWRKGEAENYPLRPICVSHCICDLEGADQDQPMLGHYWGCLEPVACYSTDWAASGPLFEQLGPGWRLVQAEVMGWAPEYRWWCIPLVGDTMMAPTPSAAICLAFLRAVEK